MGSRFVIIGCGKIAHRHAGQAIRVGQLVAACDPHESRGKNFASLFGIPVFTDLAEMFTKVVADIAVICSPNFLHPAHIKLAVDAGLTVLCEKPLCLDPTEGDEILRYVEGLETKVYLVLSARYHPVIRQLREWVLEGQLGKILSFQLNACWNRSPDYYISSNWKGKKAMDGGILFTQFSHYIDALTWCLGPMHPLAVRTANRLHPSSIEGEDLGVAILSSETMALGALHWTVNSTTKNMEISLLVVGEKGTVKIGGQYMNELQYVEIHGRAREEFRPEPESLGSGSHHDLIYDQLLLAIRNEPHSLPMLSEGISTIHLIAAIYSMQANIIR